MTSLAQPTIGTATARMTRVLFLGASVTGIAFAGLALKATLDQVAVLNPTWAIVVMTLLWSLPVVIVVTARWAPLRWVRSSTIAFLGVYCAALVTWPFAQEVHRIPDGVQPWIIYLLPMADFAAAVVLPEFAAWGFLVVSCLAAGVLRYVADGSRSIGVPIQDTLFNSMTITVFVAIVIVTLRAGRHRDETALATADEAVAAAAAAAQNEQRAFVAALTHDDVIATLLAAARATDATAPLVRGYASRALGRLDALGSREVAPEGFVAASALVNALRSTVASLTDEVAFSAPSDPPGSLPSTAARALTEATAESLRNSLRHADRPGMDTTRVVTVVVGDSGATVEIVDDGAGFDLGRLPLERYGIRLSIRHRMASIPGGSAEIESTPGAGTRVLLEWKRDSR